MTETNRPEVSPPTDGTRPNVAREVLPFVFATLITGMILGALVAAPDLRGDFPWLWFVVLISASGTLRNGEQAGRQLFGWHKPMVERVAQVGFVVGILGVLGGALIGQL